MEQPKDYNTTQRKFWSGEFGNSYIDRNDSLAKVNQLSLDLIGTTFQEIAKDFLGNLSKNSTILELGCNIGLRLLALQKLGFTNLHGLEMNKKAFEIARKNNPDITFINNSIEDYDAKGLQFDLVFTADVLIHIHPMSIDSIIRKMLNLSKEYIFGLEYYDDNLVAIKYRGHSNVLWKQNFPLLFKNSFPNIEIVKQQKFYHRNSNLCDIAYLLKKNI